MLSCKFICRRVPDVRVLLVRGMRKSHYDALGLTPKATQTDIKNAYYKMSMVFHPDKAEGNSVKFQEINMAYEILGNNKLRKLYDSGLFPTGASNYAETQEKSSIRREWTAPKSSGQRQSTQQERSQSNFYENATHFENNKARSGTYTGKTEHYDYDAWTQAHYSETFSKQEFRREERQKRNMMKKEKFERLEKIVTVTFFILAASAIYSGLTIRNWDNPSQYRYK